MRIQLKIWRQESQAKPGRLLDYSLQNVTPDMSFLEMLDMLNEQLIQQKQRPVEFDHDCREGICGQCGVMINGPGARSPPEYDYLPAAYADL